MNGKLIIAVFIALLMVGTAVTIANAQDQDQDDTAPQPTRDTGISAGDADDAPRPASASDQTVPETEDDGLLQPTPANHSEDHGGEDEGTGNETDGGDDGDGNGTDGGDGSGGDDRKSGAQEPPCDCPDDDADMAIQKDVLVEWDEETQTHRVRYIVTIESIGETTAFHVGITDDLPDFGSEWRVGGSAGHNCVIDEDNFADCYIGHFSPGRGETVIFNAFNCLIECGDDITNMATVYADNDRDHGNDNDWATVHREPCPGDPAIRKEGDVTHGDSDDPNARDDEVSFTLDIKNFGSGVAMNVTLRDELPPMNGADWTTEGPQADQCAIAQDVLVCHFGDMEPGQAAQVTVRSGPVAVQCGETITNTATIRSDNDENPSNNEDTVVLASQGCPDAQVEKEAVVEDRPESHHDQVTYTFTVTSIGEATVINVMMTDDLHDFGSEWRLGGRDAFDCMIDENNRLTCDFGDMEPGTERVVTVTAEACEIGCGEDIVNEVVIDSDNDQNPDNDRDTATVEREPCEEDEQQGAPEDQDTGQDEETS